MDDKRQQLEAFFDAYESRMNRAIAPNPVVDVEATASAFADYFVESSPAGIIGGANDDEFRTRIPQGFEFYQTVGTQAMTMSGRDFTRIDGSHWMVKIHWNARYEKADRTQVVIEFDVVYFVTTVSGEPKIFAYITGDEQGVMKEHGLIPNPQPETA